MPLTVFVSHSGKTLELDCQPGTGVEQVQQTLATLTAIPAADQILMCEGARLDVAKPLATYGLPLEASGRARDVFLYSRAHLRPGATLPPAESLPPVVLDMSAAEAALSARHPLDAERSPLLRALPDYQRQFQAHLAQATAYWEASQQRMATCAQLVSEQEVQALSIDAATSNVEVHYAYICDAFSSFMQQYTQQHNMHSDVLARFEQDLAYLATTELHPATHGEGCTLLLDLVDGERLREVAAACLRSHRHFATKVAELEQLFGLLRSDVDALFMVGPSVDLEALNHQMEEAHAQLDEEASIALSSDLGKVQQLVEAAVDHLSAASGSKSSSSSGAASMHLSDTVHMLETMHETHANHLIPRVAACDRGLEAFSSQCLDCKNSMMQDVFQQLQTISSQQSRIREMKNKLTVFREALAKQEAAVAELLMVRRAAAAYKQCLAECVRRGAFMEKYGASAARLAEGMGRFREKELATRDAFRKHVERYLPAWVLERMGLLEQPPHCQVSVASGGGELPHVSVDDVRRYQLPWSTASLLGEAGMAGAGSPAAAPAEEAAEGADTVGRAEPQADAGGLGGEHDDAGASLALENARLRAELASQIALDCIRTAQLAATITMPRQADPATDAFQQQQQQEGAAPESAMLSTDAVRQFERALAAKDGLISELQGRLRSMQGQAASYEARIRQLETQLSALAAHHPSGGAADVSSSGLPVPSVAGGAAVAAAALLRSPAKQTAAAAASPSSHVGEEVVAGCSHQAGSSTVVVGVLHATGTDTLLGPTMSSGAGWTVQHEQQQEQQQRPPLPLTLGGSSAEPPSAELGMSFPAGGSNSGSQLDAADREAGGEQEQCFDNNAAELLPPSCSPLSPLEAVQHSHLVQDVGSQQEQQLGQTAAAMQEGESSDIEGIEAATLDEEEQGDL
eukprot:scaffold18.g2015.t1